MSLPGHRRLFALADDRDRFVGATVDDLLDQRAVLLGALIDRHVIDAADKYRGGVKNLTPVERRQLENEGRARWSHIAARPGQEGRRLRAIGRGEDPDDEGTCP